MAETETEQPMTLKQRMALLNAAQVGLIPGDSPATQRPKPHIPDRKPMVKHKSFNIPSENTISTTEQPLIANLPSGPPPLPNRKQPPPLPVRKAQGQEKKESTALPATNGDNALRVTATRTKSEENGPRVKAPAWGDCHLPPLPARTQSKARTPSFADNLGLINKTSSVACQANSTTTISPNSHQNSPPPLSTRQSSTETLQRTAPRRVAPLPSPDSLEKARKASFTSNNDVGDRTTALPPLPTRRLSALPKRADQPNESLETPHAEDAPPPVPRTSRPDLAALQATKPRLNGHSQSPIAPPTSICLVCRDFSGPDNHAVLFPRQRVTSLQSLAHQLTAPFPSHTDKARAIFTWLHHNIDYNIRDFFSGNLKASTPQSTLQSGLAVCEGYAALFTNLATYAGLESIVVSGHGKGFGHTPLTLGAPIPPYNGNHAWNAVKIDHGEWKLIDTCWGAGNCEGQGKPYNRQFSPERFTQSNEEFGIDHFPNNKGHFFLAGGRTLTWEEYIQRNSSIWPYCFEPMTFFNNAKDDYSIGKHTVVPPMRQIDVRQAEPVRFSFGLFCPHWTLENHTRKGPPPVFILATGGVDGKNKHFLPFEHVQANTSGSGGDMWYLDISARELGAPGETLTLFAVTSFGNRQDARGLTVREFKDGVGRTGMGFVGVAAWELA